MEWFIGRTREPLATVAHSVSQLVLCFLCGRLNIFLCRFVDKCYLRHRKPIRKRLFGGICPKRRSRGWLGRCS